MPDPAPHPWQTSTPSHDPIPSPVPSTDSLADQLRASEARYHALVLATGQISWTASGDGGDGDGRAWQMFTGQDPAQAAAWGWLAALHPDDRERATLAWNAAVAARSIYTIDYRVRRADGVYRWLFVRGVPVYDADGTVREWVGTATDITDRHEAEAALRASAAQFRLLADQIPQLVWMAQADGHIYWYNQRWYDYTGMTPESQAGWGWQSVHDPAVLPLVLDRWERSIAQGEAFEMVFPLRGADGQFRPFLTRVLPVKDAAGQVTQWCGTNTDITAQQAVENALRAANTLKDAFLAIASHELRTPLTSAKTYLQLAQRRLAQSAPLPGAAGDGNSGPTIQQLLSASANALGRLEGLVGDLLDVARLQAGKLTLHLTRMDLCTLVKAVVEEEALAEPERVIQLTERLASEAQQPVWVMGDPDRLRQVVSNYLSNARKYSPPDEPIIIQLRVRRANAQVSVSDRGPGLRREQQAHVFEQFYQVAGITPQQGSQVGLGLGLYICRTLIEQHQGRVGVASRPGAGSRFWFTLPLATQEA